jgi:molecular chaperone DnaK
MHLGIDLGTTNSALAAFDGSAVSILANAAGEPLTPSVVRIDARGNPVVGRRAFRFLETDPGNTRAEFKRLMGTGERIAFEASGKSFLPEELSGMVLSALLADAREALGFAPRAAVISTPALFELPQNHATMRAAKLAGLEEVALIQEPVASAIAAGWRAEEADGLWLVYDLGGGTLDVSLLETRDGWLRVVDHSGDNFLGGKDFDNTLVDWALARLHAAHGLPGLSRDNPASRRTLGKLKAACEQAKIELSRAARTSIVCAGLCEDAAGDPVDVDLEIGRGELETLIAPLVERGAQVCEALLGKARISADAVARVVFVGGPTLTPAVRERIGALFGGRVAAGVDPMTLVARGAALYAATAGLDARPAGTDAASAPAPGGLAVRFEHPLVTADPEPFVVGRFLAEPGGPLPASVRIEREGGGFVSPDVPVSAEGSFLLQAALERHRQNRFRLIASTAAGAPAALRNPVFAIVHGVSIADPPLSRSVGVARSNDTVKTYFEKGTPLPARRTVIHTTVQTLAPGEEGDALLIPVVQGEHAWAHLNRLIGTLRIAGGGLARSIPAGTRVEVTLHLDRSGQLQARADLPSLGQTFEDVVHVLVPSASVEVLERELASAGERVRDLRRRAFRSGVAGALKHLTGADALLAEARAGLAPARGGDADAAQRLHRLLLDLNGALDVSEDELRWPELAADSSDEAVAAWMSWVAAWGTPTEQQICDRAVQAVLAARERRDAAELDRQMEIVRSVSLAARTRDPESPARVFRYLAGRVTEATDVPLAHTLVETGRAALDRRDFKALRPLNERLSRLLPGTAEDRRLSFGSGVQ